MNRLLEISSYKYFKQISIVVLIIFCFLTYRFYVWINTESTDNAYIEADISNVSAQVNGVIDEIWVEENNKVKKDQVIAKIQSDNYEAIVSKSESLVESARRDIELIEQNIKLAQIDKSKAKEAFEFAEENLKITQVDYNRIQKLSNDNYASKQKLDTTKIALEKAKNDYSQADLNMQTTNVKVELLEVQKLAAIAKHTITKQDAFLALRDLENTIIRSPINGVIGNSSLQIGNYVRAGITLFSVIPEKLYVKANFKETQIAKFKEGMEANLSFDSQNGHKITGIIRNISPATGSKFSIIPPANATGNITKILQRVPVTIDFTIP